MLPFTPVYIPAPFPPESDQQPANRPYEPQGVRRQPPFFQAPPQYIDTRIQLPSHQGNHFIAPPALTSNVLFKVQVGNRPSNEVMEDLVLQNKENPSVQAQLGQSKKNDSTRETLFAGSRASGDSRVAEQSLVAAEVKTKTFLEDPHRLEQRLKQVQFGYVTPGYLHYRAAHPPSEDMSTFEPTRPSTPDIHENISKRHWERKLKEWKINLHVYDSHPCPVNYEQHPEWPITQAKIEAAQKLIRPVKENFFDEDTAIGITFDSTYLNKRPYQNTPTPFECLVVNSHAFFSQSTDSIGEREASRVFDETPQPDGPVY